MTFNKHRETGFSLIEVIVAATILVTSAAVTVPIIARNRWQVDVDRYATQLESGLYSLRAKLGSRKTSCLMEFPSEFRFLEPAMITEFSQGTNSTSFNCCDSEISGLINDPDCDVGHSGHLLSEITNRPLDNLRIVQTESTPESKNVRVAVSTINFGFTPPGTTAEAGTLTFLVCHQRAALTGNPTICVPGQNQLNIRCVKIDGTGAVERGRWIQPSGSSDISKGLCQAT